MMLAILNAVALVITFNAMVIIMYLKFHPIEYDARESKKKSSAISRIFLIKSSFEDSLFKIKRGTTGTKLLKSYIRTNQSFKTLLNCIVSP